MTRSSTPHPKALEAQAMLQMNMAKQALELLDRALKTSPNDPNLHHLAGVARLHVGPIERAEFHARRALTLMPGEPVYLRGLANVLMETRRVDEAVAVLRKVLEGSPDDPWAVGHLVNTLARVGKYDEALRIGEPHVRGPKVEPDLAWGMGYILGGLGRATEAVELLTRGLEADPLHYNLASRRACATLYDPTATPAMVREAHEAYGRILQELSKIAPPFERPTAAAHDGPVRVGIISPDLREHSVAYFVEPLLASYDRSRLHVTCYSHGPEDAVSARLRPLADAWVRTVGMDMQDVADLIRSHGVDVLIELAGHTSGNCLMALVRGPAPVIATYLGYPASTGVHAVHYRIVDSLTDPPGTEDHAVEELVRIDPCFICYRVPTEEMPDVAPPPSSVGGPPTFGSFNNFAKINERVIDLWARLLAATPGSRLLLKSGSLTEPAVQQRVREQFARRGVDGSRIEPLPKTPSTREHLAMYAKVDVALDPFPYNGTTTTCEAMAMGVPTVTLVGDRHAGRVGLSIMTNTGLSELVARDEAQYIEIARSLALDTARLRSLRGELRGRMLASALCDAPAFGRRFSDAVTALWARACERHERAGRER